MKRISIRMGLLLAGASVTALPLAFGYVLMGPKWSGTQVTYYVNPNSLDVSAAASLAAIQQGASAWSTQANTGMKLVYGGATNSTTLANNGRNEIFFRNETSTSGSGVIATTYTWWNSANQIVDSDMVFWDAAFRFFTGTGGCSGGMYIEDVATHEFGHFLGLNHSSSGDATMYPSISQCSQGSRSLASDDVAGIQALYPPSTTTSPTPSPAPSPAPAPTLSAPSNPRPGNGSTRVSVNADLAWSAVTGATGYDVYFGTTSNPPLVASNIRTTSYALPRLAYRVYYWRVVAKSSTSSRSSTTWSFRTY